MIFSGNALVDAIVYTIVITLILMVPFAINPRLFWNDMPPSIKEKTDPPTNKEKTIQWLLFILLIAFGIGFPIFSALGFNTRFAGRPGFWPLFWHLFWQPFGFNLVDLLILDWLVFATINPKWMSMPGTQGDPAYKEYRSHFVGFLIGTGLSIILSAGIAYVVYQL